MEATELLLSYRYWRLISNPMVDEMVPDSWFEYNSLWNHGWVDEWDRASADLRDVNDVRTELQVWRATQWSMEWFPRVGWRISSYCAQMNQPLQSILGWNSSSRRKIEMALVQKLKIGEWSNGWWNGSRELIVLEVAVCNKFKHINQFREGWTVIR